MAERPLIPPLLDHECPNFTANSQLGPIPLHDFIDDVWTVIFTCPSPFDPVHSSEITAAAQLKEEFSQRNCKLLAIVLGSTEQNDHWLQDASETSEATVNFPVIADEDGEIHRLFGMIPPEAPAGEAAVFKRPFSSLLIIDDLKMVKSQAIYPATTGHNFFEAIRLLEALQVCRHHKVGTPSNWACGEDVFIDDSVSALQAKDMFDKGFAEILPYFRLTPMPDMPAGLMKEEED
eukprot:g2653.t1